MKLLLLSALFVFSLSATTIQFQVTTSGTTGTYDYFVSGFTAMQPCLVNNVVQECSDEIDINFDPTVFSQLSNGVAPAGFSLLLFQPNNPPQSPGDYSALAVDANPALAPFSVDFTLTSMGIPLPIQTFTINEFENVNGGFGNGQFVGVAGSGQVTPESTVPEPASLSLIGAAMIIGGIFLGCRFSVKRAGCQ
jgi:hypothetical protein